MNLNVGVGVDSYLGHPLVSDCLNVDIEKVYSCDLLCDVTHLPFQDRIFENVYCFHVLEHLESPAKALNELIRVSSNMIEIEVPHRFSKAAKMNNESGKHLCSFRGKWFNEFFYYRKELRFCSRAIWLFPRNINLHVWIYRVD